MERFLHEEEPTQWLLLGASCHLASTTKKQHSTDALSLFVTGISMNVQPMYFGESAPKHLRGAISLSSAVFTAFGVVLGQVVGLRYGRADLTHAPQRRHRGGCVDTDPPDDLFIGRFWAASPAGSISLPATPSPASSSWSPCPGSRRAPATCSSTAGTRRPAFKVRPDRVHARVHTQ